jgi:hypothetical protein
MSTAHQLLPARVTDSGEDYVLPQHLAEGHDTRGPRFADDVWDLRAFVPRTVNQARLDFTTLTDAIARRTVKEYLYSRIRRGSVAGGGTSRAKPLKITYAYTEFNQVRMVLATFRQLGANRLVDVTRHHLTAALERWKRISVHSAAHYVVTVKHLAAHGAFLSQDRLSVTPWPGRSGKTVAGLRQDRENSTPRIPEQIIGPLLKAAVFYVDTASRDILEARREVACLDAARGDTRLAAGEAEVRLRRFIATRREQGRGIPALPHQRNRGTVAVIDGVPQAPNTALVCQLANVGKTGAYDRLLHAAGAELGYEIGGLDTPMSIWPDSGRPWRPRLDPLSLNRETTHLRAACWIVIAYLSGMRDREVRELRRDCAFTDLGDDGRTRYKLRGRVFKGRQLGGDDAEWVVLDVVHRAVAILLDLNDDPTHLFGYRRGDELGYVLLCAVFARLDNFRDHVNDLFSTPGHPFIPTDTVARNDNEDDGLDADDRIGEQVAWHLTPNQFRRTLAWHIAHQPFGVVAGTRQYQHAKIALFEGYAGISASGFAAEVAAEETISKLDYLEDLYRDWNDGSRSSGGAAMRIDAEFDRVRRELGDLPGVVANPARLRSLLAHLTKVLHPGVLNDCFHQPATAVCGQRAQALGRPLPMHNMCTICPNARRTTVHLPRLVTARNQAQQALIPLTTGGGSIAIPPLQQAAITEYVAGLDRLIAELQPEGAFPA